jgi:hypothetical protein
VSPARPMPARQCLRPTRRHAAAPLLAPECVKCRNRAWNTAIGNRKRGNSTAIGAEAWFSAKLELSYFGGFRSDTTVSSPS